MGVFAEFLSVEGEVYDLHWYGRMEIVYYKERLDTCTDDLIAYYRMEDTINFDRQLVIDMLKKIDSLYSMAEALKMVRLQEEEEELREQEAREEEARLEAEESSSTSSSEED